LKANLQLKLGQSLTMTPQLQQAIRLLQLGSVELQQEIQQVLDSNLMLELEDSGLQDIPEPRETDDNDSPSDEETDEANTSDQLDNREIPDDMPVDSQWEDIYPDSSADDSRGHNDGDNLLETRNAAPERLQDHLHWQLNLTPMSDRDRVIANALIDAVDPSGMLNQDIGDIYQGLCANWPENTRHLLDEDPLEQDEVMTVLHRLQQFDPPGVAARNLQECLLIQLDQMPENTPWIFDAREIVREHIDRLAAHDYKAIMQKSGIRENTLKEAIKLIISLNPIPGERIETGSTEYVTPDVVVYKKGERWRVELNRDTMPRLRINPRYLALVRRADTSPDGHILKEHLQEARWFLKSLENRHDTLLKVATAIVQYQRGFLEYGPEAMKPLVLNEIADKIGMHESTVSRVTSNKYMHTPRGLFELKYFFSSHVATSDGGECSSVAIRAMIKKLVAEEPSDKPFSDSKLVELMESQGIKVARRTVAKYREALRIAPSSERKQLG